MAEKRRLEVLADMAAVVVGGEGREVVDGDAEGFLPDATEAEALVEHDLPHDTSHVAPPILVPFDEECDQGDKALPGKPKRQLAYWQWPLRPFFDLHDWLVLLSSVFGAPLVISIILVYGVNQGFAGSLQDLVTSYFWKDTLHAEPAVAQVYAVRVSPSFQG